MRNVNALVLLLGAAVSAQTPSANPLTNGATLHYGNVVTYMRLKGVVPPSSEPPFGVYKPK